MIIKNCWLVRASCTNPQGEARSFLHCALKPAFSLVGKKSNKISDTLKTDDLAGANLSIAVGIADSFVNRIKPEDILIVANKLTPDVIILVRVIGRYNYDVEHGWHFREIEYLHEIPRASLPKQFRDSVLRTPRIVAKIAFDSVNPLLDKSFLDNPTSLVVKFPLRPDFSIDFAIPSDLTERESERFSAFIKTLFQKEG